LEWSQVEMNSINVQLKWSHHPHIIIHFFFLVFLLYSSSLSLSYSGHNIFFLYPFILLTCRPSVQSCWAYINSKASSYTIRIWIWRTKINGLTCMKWMDGVDKWWHNKRNIIIIIWQSFTWASYKCQPLSRYYLTWLVMV